MSYEEIRKEAREVAKNCHWVGGDLDGLVWAGESADAASDVWEPIVERLMQALRDAGVPDTMVEAIAFGIKHK